MIWLFDVYVDDSPHDLPATGGMVEVAQFIGGNPADRALFRVIDDLDRLVAGA